MIRSQNEKSTTKIYKSENTKVKDRKTTTVKLKDEMKI